MSALHVRTPLIESYPLSKIAKCDVFLKLENNQPSASFKLRGIGFHMKQEVERGKKNFVCSSGGNAGLAAAHAAKKLNVSMTICVPGTTPETTKEKLRADGADVIVVGHVWNDADQKAQELVKEKGYTYIHPFDESEVWQGHASIIDEIAEDLNGAKPDLVITVVGGGGLLCGLCQGLDARGWKDVPVLAMETIGADCFNVSVRENRVVTLPAITSIAICLGALRPCDRAWQYYKERPILSATITDVECVEAIESFLEDHRIMVEPACAAAVGALYTGLLGRLVADGKLPTDMRRIVLVVCGGYQVSLGKIAAWKEKLGMK